MTHFRDFVVDERHGVTAEIVAVIAEGAFYHLAAPVRTSPCRRRRWSSRR
jgi:pyruvate/2-oxoglutarate/acetoin dehydrogenase E1 component